MIGLKINSVWLRLKWRKKTTLFTLSFMNSNFIDEYSKQERRKKKLVTADYEFSYYELNDIPFV